MSQPVPRSMPTHEQRLDIVQHIVRDMTMNGWRLENTGEYYAVFVGGRPVNHVVHLLATVFTCLLWIPVWLIVIATGGEQRKSVFVDEWGNALWR